MRICILTRSALAANPRVTKEATALKDAGHDVTIIAGEYAAWSSNFSDVAAPSGVTVRRVTYGPSAPLLKRLWQVFRRKAAIRILKHSTDNVTLASLAACDATPGLKKAAVDAPADLYIAHYDAALPAAAAGAEANNAAYAFDAEDFHPGDLPDEPKYEFDNRVIRVIESTYLPGCLYVTAASPGIADAYAERYRISPPKVVLNVFPKHQAPEAPARAGSFAPGPSLYWFSQMIGPERGLECAINAISLAESAPHLVLRGMPVPGYADHLRTLAADAQVGDRLHFLDPGPPNDMERLAAPFDLGFVGETGVTFNRRIALTNKQFTYLLAGLPTIMSDVPAHIEFERQASGAVWIYKKEDPKSLASTLDSVLMKPVKLAASRRRAFELGQSRFNWDVEQQTLVETVESAMAGNGPKMIIAAK